MHTASLSEEMSLVEYLHIPPDLESKFSNLKTQKFLPPPADSLKGTPGWIFWTLGEPQT